ncbi:nitroreductase family protein [Streptomyces sp. NPDC057743]|uniref:nitroreductase family protein n=1 Tax=Streptomyces sp. NPDC057743 TaxID=3346236 RepID=UPI003680820C
MSLRGETAAPRLRPEPAAVDYLAPQVVPVPVRLPDAASDARAWPGSGPVPTGPPDGRLAAIPLPWPPLPGPDLGTLLHTVYGLTRAQWLTGLDRLPLVGDLGALAGEPGGGPVPRRPVPSAGALYAVRLSCVLPAGCYRYDPLHHRLLPLRASDHRAALGMAPTAAFGWVCTVSLRAIAARYGEFGYRYGCVETGVVTAQAEVVAAAAGLRAVRVAPFDPTVAADLLCLDPLAEPVTEVVAFHPVTSTPRARHRRAGAPATPPSGPAPTVPRRTLEPPPGPVDALLPRTAALLRALHRGPATPIAGNAFQEEPLATAPTPDPHHPTLTLPRPHPLDLAQGLPHRRAALRGFARLPIEPTDFATVLAAAEPTDGLLFCYVNDVAGLPRGLFRYLPDARHRLLPVSVGNPGPALAACAVQDFVREGFLNAAAGLIWAADPDQALQTHGADGVRLRYTDVGAAAHRAGLAAAARGLASRVNADFLAGKVDELLGLHTELPATTLLLQLGHPAHGTTRPEHRLGPPRQSPDRPHAQPQPQPPNRTQPD